MGWEPLIRTRRSTWIRLSEHQREKERTQFIREQRAFKAREVNSCTNGGRRGLYREVDCSGQEVGKLMGSVMSKFARSSWYPWRDGPCCY